MTLTNDSVRESILQSAIALEESKLKVSGRCEKLESDLDSLIDRMTADESRHYLWLWLDLVDIEFDEVTSLMQSAVRLRQRIDRLEPYWDKLDGDQWAIIEFMTPAEYTLFGNQEKLLSARGIEAT